MAILSIESHSNDYLKYIFNYQDTYNIFGETGLITIPSAKVSKSGSLYFNYSSNDIFKYGSLVITPFDWLESSFFYYRPTDIYWIGENTRGQYLDKGFSVKFSKKVNDNFTIGLGFSDFAGTGLFTREYILGTFETEFMRVSSGIGFGKFIFEDGFSNPIAILKSSFKTRPDKSNNFKTGGSPNYDQWFRGNAKFIGGVEFFLPGIFKGTTIKVEHDPYDYYNNFSSFGGGRGELFEIRKKDSQLNFGLNKSFGDNFNLGVFFIKGNTITLNFSFGGNFSKSFFKKKLPEATSYKKNKGNTPKETFYEDLILNINSKDIFLQSTELNDGNIKVAVASSKYRNPIHIHAVLGDTVKEVQIINPIAIQSITTIGINVGQELHQITSPISAFKDRQNSAIELIIKDSVLAPGNGDAYKSFEFRPTINYPASFTGIAPSLVNHIGDPVKFYYGGIILRLDNEIQFSSRLQLNTEIHQNIENNFDEKRNFPDSLLPRVRTDIVSYLQESDTYISRMQLDYFFNPYKEVFGKFSTGILENMYAGAGVEFLYKPFNQNFSIGLEAYRVKKRAFDRKFDLLDYEINTGHINFNYHLPQWGILGTFSYGKYLAGDEGFTFDISRRLSSGFRAGIFFTQTNVSAEQFGEGSFDKGFYFQIPIDLFLNDYRGGYINFKLRPLTRDGGQKLEAGNDLIGIMHSTSRAEIERDWSSFND